MDTKFIIYTLIILWFALMISSCSQKTETASAPVDPHDTIAFSENVDFQTYLESIDKIALPVVIKGCAANYGSKKIVAHGNEQQLKNDNPYFKNLEPVFGQIPSNGNYFATITLGVADCFIPSLTTFDRSGKLIDSKRISIGYCGSDCGYYCEEFMSIDNDYIIFTSDTVTSYECDSLGEKIPGTDHNYVIYKKGKLLTTGKIELTEEIKKELELK